MRKYKSGFIHKALLDELLPKSLDAVVHFACKFSQGLGYEGKNKHVVMLTMNRDVSGCYCCHEDHLGWM